jgi:hypothetical protein
MSHIGKPRAPPNEPKVACVELHVQDWYDHVIAYYQADSTLPAVDVPEGPVADHTDAFTEPTFVQLKKGALQRAIAILDSTSTARSDGIPAAFV